MSLKQSAYTACICRTFNKELISCIKEQLPKNLVCSYNLFMSFGYNERTLRLLYCKKFIGHPKCRGVLNQEYGYGCGTTLHIWNILASKNSLKPSLNNNQHSKKLLDRYKEIMLFEAQRFYY